jgi:hypothetical protein
MTLQDMRGRAVNLMPYWDGTAWHEFLPVNDVMVRIKIEDVGQCFYLASERACPDDRYSALFELLNQHLSYEDVIDAAWGLFQDIAALASIAVATDIIWTIRDQAQRTGTVGVDVAALVETQLEVMLTNTRSALDLLHDIVLRVWKHTVLLQADGSVARHKSTLPTGLSKLCLSGSKIVTAAELETKYGLPPRLTVAYTHIAKFLLCIRGLRDGVVHHGKRSALVVIHDRDFVCPSDEPLGKAMASLLPSKAIDKNLVSVRGLMATIFSELERVAGEVAVALNEVLSQGLPPAVSPGNRVWCRVPNQAALTTLDAIASGAASPWRDAPLPRDRPQSRRVRCSRLRLPRKKCCCQ